MRLLFTALLALGLLLPGQARAQLTNGLQAVPGLNTLRAIAENWQAGEWNFSTQLTRMPLPSPSIPATNETPKIIQMNEQGFRALNRGENDEAFFYFSKALEQNPDDKRARFGIGTLLISTDKAEEAVNVLARLGIEYPNDYYIFNNLAWVMATTEHPLIYNPKEAVLMSRNALVIAPGDYHLWSTLAEAYYAYGDYEKALRAAIQALELLKLTPAGNNPNEIATFTKQVEKCQQASAAMSLVE